MQNPFDGMPLPNNGNHLMRPINQRVPNTNNINNSNSASLPSQAGLNEASFRPASVINLSHSNDVVIGPMTQYQGSVTIYQYMDATVEASVGRMPGSTGLGESTIRIKNEKIKILLNLKSMCNRQYVLDILFNFPFIEIV